VATGAVYPFSLPVTAVTNFGNPFFPPDGGTDDVYGVSVAIGPFAAIGAAEHSIDTNSPTKGAVYFNGGELGASDGEDFFGAQVALNGDTLLVQALGAVYVFVGGVQQAKLPPSVEGFKFNVSFALVDLLAISGDTAAIVAENSRILRYQRTETNGVTNWSLQQTNSAADASPLETVAIDGDTLVAGAPGTFVAGVTGAVYVFEPPSAPSFKDLRDLINGLPNTAFKAVGLRSAMLSVLADTETANALGDTAEAIQKLQNLRRRVDGCPSVADTNDWIIDCPAQLQFRTLLDGLLAALGS